MFSNIYGIINSRDGWIIEKFQTYLYDSVNWVKTFSDQEMYDLVVNDFDSALESGWYFSI